jgi:hypothetical protein
VLVADVHGAAAVNLTKLAETIGTMPGYSTQTPTAEIVAWLREEVSAPVPSRFVTALTILSELPLLADSILGKLRAAAAQNESVYWAVEALRGQGLDVCDPVTQARIDYLSSAEVSLFTAEEASALKGMRNQTATRLAALGGSPSDEDGYIAQVVDGVRGWI